MALTRIETSALVDQSSIGKYQVWIFLLCFLAMIVRTPRLASYFSGARFSGCRMRSQHRAIESGELTNSFATPIAPLRGNPEGEPR